MRTTLACLRRFVDLPASATEARALLDDLGLEVKRFDASTPGTPVTLELLANRGDHHALVGLAREVGGRTGTALRLPDSVALPVGAPPHPVVVETPLCAVYGLVRLDRVGEGTLSAEALAVLEASGQKSVHPVVDATNIANLELGQPTHAFDAAKVVGTIRVRIARPGELATPLFAAGPVAVPEGAVVIADDEKVLAIAGVIGCEESKTTAQTRSVLLETATFDAVAVRKAARALGIHTDSSARFERGGDPLLPPVGAGRVARLLADAGWEVVGDLGMAASWNEPARVVPFDPAACRAFLAIDEADEALWERLIRYGFARAAGGAVVPSWRLPDVAWPADLYEEIAKSIGYNHTPQGLPLVDMGALPSSVERALDAVSEVLVAAGFYEVITDGFYGRAVAEQLGFVADHPLAAHVETQNALDRGYSNLKNNALGQALDGVAQNLRHKHDQIQAFEWTRTFHPDPAAANGVCTERRLLWAIASGLERPRGWSGSGRALDVYSLKGIVEEVAATLRLPLDVGSFDPTYPLASALHPGRSASIRREGRVVGVVGEVHPEVVAAWRLKRVRPVYLELELDALLGEPLAFQFREPPRVPPVPRSLAFTVPPGVEVGEILAVLREAGGEGLTHLAVNDRFDHDRDGSPVSTYTFELAWANDDASATGDAINEGTRALIEAVALRLGGRGVTLRA